ncbi:MAG: hypothetical protein ACRD30_05930 [Bryobacteraceae bacterium]
MRRFSANLLLVLFTLLPIVPAFAGPESGLPACCRRSGKHHCALDQGSSWGPQARAVAEHCPYVPGSTVSRTASDRFAIAPAQAASVFVSSKPLVLAQAEARARISFSRSRQKRGPPDLDA